MAARGTGLPDMSTGAITPVVDLSSMGAAERVAADGFSALAQGIGRVHEEVLKPLVVDQARKDAAEAVLDGRFEQRDQISEYGRAYNQLAVQGTAARYARDDDAFLTGLATETPNDPGAFAARALNYRSEQLKARPSDLAMVWTAVFDSRRNDLQGNILTARTQQDARENAAHLIGRRDDLVARIARNAELGAAYDDTDPRFQADLVELDSIWNEIEANPLLTVNREEADRLKQANIDSFGAAGFTGLVRRTFRTDGPDAALALITSALPAVGDDGEGLPVFITPGAGERPAGLIQPGTVDLTRRPSVTNPDGTVRSTVRSITIEQDGKFIVVPTVSDDGRILSDNEAVAAYETTGGQLGVFDSQQAADSYAETLHQDQAAGRTGAPVFTGRARELALQQAREAFAQESGLVEQRQNIADSARRAASVSAGAMLEAMRYGGTVDQARLTALAQASGDPSLVAKVRWTLEHGAPPPPGYGGGNGAADDFDGDSSAAPGFQAAVDFVIDDIEGGEAFVADDNGRGPTRFGINATANPDLDIRNLSRAAAVRRYRDRYWTAIGADNLPPPLALVAFDAAVNQGPENARRWIEESGGDVSRYLSLREAHYRDLARSDPMHARQLGGWLTRLERVRARAGRVAAFSNTADGFAGDPLSYAMGANNRPALARVAELPVDGYASADAGQQLAWANAVRSRYATGETLAAQYQVPRRIFTDGEVTAYTARFRDDPRLVIPFASQLVSALGGRKAREALVELGQANGAGTIIHIADLAAGGGDRRFADQAAAGLARTSAGERLDNDTRQDFQAELRRWRTPFADSPQFLQAVANAAQSAALADDAAGDMRSPAYYVQAAMGRTSWNGRSYGGAGAVNDGVTIFPRWLNPEYADDALEAFGQDWFERGRGPVYSNDQPIPAREIGRMRMRLQPNGRYRLVDRHGATAYARSGRPFEVDFDAGRAFLERRLGRAAVRP